MIIIVVLIKDAIERQIYINMLNNRDLEKKI